MDKRGNLAIFVAGLLSIFCLVDSDPNTDMVDHKCNSEYDVDEIYFKFCLETMLDSLPKDTADHGYNWYTSSTTGILHCFGHGACYGGLSRDECISCLKKAYLTSEENCEWSTGVQFQFVDCRLRYEKYEFKED